MFGRIIFVWPTLVIAAAWLVIVSAAYAVFYSQTGSEFIRDTVCLAVLTPGGLLDILLSYNIHGGFGGWRGATIEVLGSWIVWTLVSVPVFQGGRWLARTITRRKAV